MRMLKQKREEGEEEEGCSSTVWEEELYPVPKSSGLAGEKHQPNNPSSSQEKVACW